VVYSPEEEIRELRALFWSDRDPEGRVFAPLADAYRRAGEHALAIEVLSEGLRRQPDFVPGHVVFGWVRRDRWEPAEAAAAFRAALALDAENADALEGLAELGGAAESADRPEAADAAPEPHRTGDGLLTRTMADLYARQGLFDRALDVYRRLLERDPGDRALRDRVRELEARAGSAVPTHDDEVEALARDLAEGPGHVGELRTSFAWTPAPAPPPGKPRGAHRGGLPVREYFRALLGWEPAAEHPVVPVASLAPDAVPIASLAPDVVPIASLAPDVVPIASLAPDVVPIASLAPDEPAPRDDFSSWLQRLR